MRLRITFNKADTIRFTGHLDLLRAWERTFRRARLPLVYSQGYNPRPKLNLAAALPLGFTSQCEIIEVWLERELLLDELHVLLNNTVPPGIEIIKIAAVDQTSRKIPNIVISTAYTVSLIDPLAQIDSRIDDFMAEKEIVRQRRGKNYDLRPLVEALWWDKNDQGSYDIHMQLSARQGATGRPEEVLLALGADPQRARIHRTALILDEPDI
jgi:radical SAM-linked protein